MTPDPDPVDPSLVARAADAGAGPCPDASEVAGFAEGRLSDAEAEGVAAHAAGCAACRDAIAEVAEAVEPSASEPAPARLRLLPSPRGWAVAAALLVAAGVGTFLLARPRGGGEPTEADADLDVRLALAARDLASAEPRLFAGFAPLSRAERNAPWDGLERGGPTLLAPAETVLSDRPTFRWVEVPGAGRYEVAVSPEGGAPAWRRTTSDASLPYPQDAPPLARSARYAWTVATEGVLGGRSEGRRVFSVASAEEVAAFERASGAIAERVDADAASLLAAHWALRRGLLEEAERLAREHLARDPDEPVGRETLRGILRRRGAPEADAGADPARDGR